jgi:ABC-2 type transport system ATP-binding protein
MTAANREIAIAVTGLRKAYGSLVAVNDVSLEVYASEIFGILGPNGAGKTTTLEMIEGLRSPDTGEISVAGFNILEQPDQVKRHIGIQLQSTSLFDFLTVGELVSLFASLYGADNSIARIHELLGFVSLHEKIDDYAQTLSGGQQQRLSIALALVNDPEVVFLDEPTTGLDPQARRNLWDLIEHIRSQGKTIVLTTHYMEEAEILCDRVAVMDEGRIIHCDTPGNLIATLDQAASIEASYSNLAPDDRQLEKLPGVRNYQVDGTIVSIQTRNLPQTMAALMELSRETGQEIDQLATSRPTLEDVFLHYTGRSLRS